MQQKSSVPLFRATQGEPDHRTRLLEGMARALAEKSYGDVTIGDVVRHARVSKRTFYEYFADKEACFLATYGAIADELLRRVAEAAKDAEPGEDQLYATTDVYFAALEEQRAMMRAFLSEVHAAGPSALSLRRTIHARFASLLVELVRSARHKRPDLRDLSPELASALVGGINELVLTQLDSGACNLTRARAAAVELISRVLGVR